MGGEAKRRREHLAATGEDWGRVITTGSLHGLRRGDVVEVEGARGRSCTCKVIGVLDAHRVVVRRTFWQWCRDAWERLEIVGQDMVLIAVAALVGAGAYALTKLAFLFLAAAIGR